MKIGELARALGGNLLSADGDMDVDILDVACDDRAARRGSLFVCVPGFDVDGCDFAESAAARGAVALIAERPPERIPLSAEARENVRAVLRVRDARRALAAVSNAFFGEPSKRFTLTGITGTKGKTTTAYMVYDILRAAGRKAGLTGSIEWLIGDESVPARATTPESLELQRLFSRMADAGTDTVVMEVSSQGLALGRVDCCDFDVGVFTNLYRDHISPREHADMDAYLKAKLSLFAMCRAAVVNADIPEYAAVRRACEAGGRCERILSYSATPSSEGFAAADIRASGIEPARNGGALSVGFFAETPWFSGYVALALPGRYNVSNALAAIGVCGLCGVPEAAIRSGLSRVRVRGRTEPVDEGQDFTVLVDYAHNAASLEALLLMLKEYGFSGITTVFGCGGDRARDRRFEMGEVSGRLSGLTVVTSDNPRGEDPRAIMADIETGLRRSGGRYVTVADRREAIARAIGAAAPGSLVLIAGKGHETTQTFHDRTVDFDDAAVARECLKGIYNI